MKTVCITKPGENLYDKTLDLRLRVLRLPLGLSFDENTPNEEFDHIHICLLEDENLIACLILQPLSVHEIIMRQVAVEPNLQGKGIGRILVNYAEEIANEKGYKMISLCARENVIPFYEKLHYNVISDRFYEVGIPHKSMQKILTNV